MSFSESLLGGKIIIHIAFIPSLPLYFYYLRVAAICTASVVVLSVPPMALESPLVIISAVLQ